MDSKSHDVAALFPAAVKCAPVEFAALAAEARQHRVLYLKRGAVVAVTTLVSIGGAFLWHTLLVGGIVLVWVFTPVKLPEKKLPEPAGLIGTIDLTSAEETPLEGGGNSLAALGQPVALVTPAIPTLPDVTFVAPPVPVVEAPQLPAAIVVPVDEPGSVKVQLPPRHDPAANTGAPAIVNSAAPPGIDRGDPDRSGEPMFNAMKGDGIGEGDGTGVGFGRGPAGGDRLEPLVIFMPIPPAGDEPEWLRFNRPKHETKISVVVLTNGKLGQVTLEESSGRPDVDAYYMDIVQRGKYAPAVRAGKVITASKSLIFNGSLSP